MPQHKPCPLCGQPMSRQSPRCRACAVKDPLWRARMSAARKGKRQYKMTDAIRAKMSAAQRGLPKIALRGRKRPAHAAAMKAWWTAERREAKRQEMLGRNPDARYHGLSCKSAARLVKRIGRCEKCNHDGSESRLEVHHKNRDKHDQRLENLEVLCHRCHMTEHASAGETGWDSYHRKRKMIQDSQSTPRRPAALFAPPESTVPSSR